MLFLDIVTTLTGMLGGQPFVIVLLLTILFLVSKRYLKISQEKDEISNKAIKLATLFEEQNSKNNEASTKNLEMNKEILSLVKEIKSDIKIKNN